MATVLTVDGLETAFSSEHGSIEAVRGVSFELREGETLALVGESGCGKTTTALSIMQLLPPTARIVTGRVTFDGVDLVAAPSPQLRRVRGRRIAMVFQDSMTSLNPVLPIGLQISESLRVHLGLRRAGAKRRAVELLHEVGISDPSQRLRQYPHQLSGGLRQRVAIAIALAPNPEILIADEPTTALDVTVRAQVLELLRQEQQQRRMAMLVITHDLGVVAGISDRVAVMYAGRIVEYGRTETVFDTPRHPYTIGLLRSVPRVDQQRANRLPSINGSPPAMAALPSGCPFEPRCGLAFDRCRAEDPPLMSVGSDGHVAACWATDRTAAA